MHSIRSFVLCLALALTGCATTGLTTADPTDRSLRPREVPADLITIEVHNLAYANRQELEFAVCIDGKKVCETAALLNNGRYVVVIPSADKVHAVRGYFAQSHTVIRPYCGDITVRRNSRALPASIFINRAGANGQVAYSHDTTTGSDTPIWRYEPGQITSCGYAIN